MPYTIVAQDNGKILIGGNFDYYNYSPASAIARANADGSTNTSFDSGSGFGPGFTTPVYEIVVQNDGKIITVGDFKTYNGNCRNYIARLEDPCFGLYSTSIVDTTVCEFFEGNWGQIYSTSGTYLEVIPNYLGCDSTIIYNVTIINSTASNIAISGCDLASLNGTDYFTSGTYTQIIPNSVGCDSTITVDVEIFESTFSVIDHTACESFNLNGVTYTTGGTFIQTIPNSMGCDSTITLNLSLIPSPINVAVTQAGILLLSLETVGTFQWLDCNNGYSEIPGENLALFGAPTIGSFAVKIEQSGCVDTSSCFDIDSSDFYGTPGYVPLYAEVFAFPATTIDSCDATAMAFVSGGVLPYTYDWYTQSNNENSDFPDSLCYGIHTLKVVDAIGDSVLVDYYVTDTANFNTWYDTLFTGFVDTVYVNVPNCLLNYSLPLDSGEITQLFYIGPDTIAPFELLFIEFTYFQGGITYVHQDTISMSSDSWNLIYFSVYCPIKSSSNVKSMLFGFSTSMLSTNENDSRIPIKVFPNPTDGNFTIENLPQLAIVELWTATGQIIFVGSASNGKFEFNLAEYSDGIYFVRVLSEGIITNVKFVKN
jgi:hypothetical protein